MSNKDSMQDYNIQAQAERTTVAVPASDNAYQGSNTQGGKTGFVLKHGVPRFDPRNWFYYNTQEIHAKFVNALHDFTAVVYNPDNNTHKRSDLISSSVGVLTALGHLVRGVYRSASLLYTLAPVPTPPVVVNKTFRKYVTKSLMTSFLVASSPYWVNHLSGAEEEMSLQDGLRVTHDFIADRYMKAARFTENRIDKNRQDFFERHNVVMPAYDYFSPFSEADLEDPYASAIRSFALGGYKSRSQDLNYWSKTQIALVAYHATGIDPRMVVSLSDREANGTDIVADNSSALGFAQYIESSWLNSLNKNKNEMIAFLNKSGLVKETAYGEAVSILSSFDQPFKSVLDVSTDTVYRQMKKEYSDKELDEMTLYEFYREKLRLIARDDAPDYKGIQLAKLLNWRMDNVMTGLVVGFDRMDESKGALAFKKTKDLSKDEFLTLVASEYSKHHLGLRQWSRFNSRLKSSWGRNTYPSQYTVGKKNKTYPFRAAIRSNPGVFYKDGKTSRPRTFGELEEYYKDGLRRFVDVHYGRIDTPVQDLALEGLLRVPASLGIDDIEAWKKDAVHEQSSFFRPNRRGKYLADLSDLLPENFNQVPSWSKPVLEVSHNVIAWVVGENGLSIDKSLLESNALMDEWETATLSDGHVDINETVSVSATLVKKSPAMKVQ